jgi:hypothetical protein
MKDARVKENKLANIVFKDLNSYLFFASIIFIISGVMMMFYCLLSSINPFIKPMPEYQNPLVLLGIGFFLICVRVYKNINSYRFVFRVILFMFFLFLGFFIYDYVFSYLGY